MKKRTKPLARPRTPPINRKLTKERVAAAIISLRNAGAAITAKALRTAAGGKGSFSTLTRLRREIESESPELIQTLGVSRMEAVAFIEGCDRSDLPALEEAMMRRRRVIRLSKGYLVLELHETPEATRVLEDLGAEHRYDIGWTLAPTSWNFENAKRHGFTSNVEAAIRGELLRITARAEYRT